MENEMNTFKEIAVGDSFTVDKKNYTKIKRNINEGKPINSFFSVGESKLGLYFADSIKVNDD